MVLVLIDQVLGRVMAVLLVGGDIIVNLIVRAKLAWIMETAEFMPSLKVIMASFHHN